MTTINDIRIAFVHLNFETQEEVRSIIRDFIKNDPQRMAVITDLATEEFNELWPDPTTAKLTLEDNIDLKLDDVVDKEAANSIWGRLDICLTD